MPTPKGSSCFFSSALARVCQQLLMVFFKQHASSWVQFGKNTITGMPVALKTVYIPELAERELAALVAINSNRVPNVVQLLDTFIDEDGHRVLVFPPLTPLQFGDQNMKQICHKMECLLQVATTNQLVISTKAKLIVCRPLLHCTDLTLCTWTSVTKILWKTPLLGKCC